MQFELTRQVLAAFEDEGVDYVVFGGVAVNLHGLARTTRDLDVMLRADAENIERARRALRSVFDDPHIDEIDAVDLLGDYPAVQYVPPVSGFHIDILTRLGEAFDYESIDGERVDMAGVRVRVATPAALYAMKRDTVRMKDRADAEALRLHFDLGES